MGLDILVEHTTNGPYLSMPPYLASLDPAWSTCDVVYWGAFDPPIALHTATALVKDPGKNSLPTAAPGSPVTPPHAPATPTPPHIDPGSLVTHSPTPKSGPQGPEQHDPHSSDPTKSSANDPETEPQDPDEQNPDPPDPVDPSTHGENGDSAASTANSIPPNGINVAPEHPEVDSGPQLNDPQAGGTTSPVITLVNGDIITAGGKAATVSDTTVSLAPNDDALVVNGNTSPLPLPPISFLTVAGQTLTPAPTGFAIGTQRVLPGGPPVIFAGSTFLLASDSNELIINGKTTPLASAPISVFKIGSQTFTAASTGFKIGTQQISPDGEAKMVDGTLISLGSADLVIGTSTMPLGSAAQATDGALGSLIMGGFGEGAGPTNGSSNGSSIVQFTGESNKQSRVGFGTVILALIANVGAAMVALELL